MDLLSRPPRTAHEAERAVLGAVMLDPDRIAEVRAILPAAAWYLPAHRIIWDAIEALIQQGSCPDLVTVKDYLRVHGSLEETGGTQALRQLLEEATSTGNVTHHADIVRSAWVSRSIRATCVRIAKAADAGVESGEVLAERAIKEMTGLLDAGAHDEGVEVREAVRLALLPDRSNGWVTSLDNLHRLVPRYREGELIVIAGRPGHGKTTLMRTCARDLAEFGGVLVYSLEESPEEFAGALVASEAEVPKGALLDRGLHQEQQQRVDVARKTIENLPIIIERARTVEQIVARARRWARRRPINAIIVDYLQLLTSGQRGGYTKRHLELGEVTRQLKLLAQELRVVVFVGSQLSRASQHAGVGARRPRLADLRDSGAIEADADVVLGVFSWHLEDPQEWNRCLVEIGVLKQRKGQARGAAVVKTDGARFSRAPFGDIKGYEPQAKMRSA